MLIKNALMIQPLTYDINMKVKGFLREVVREAYIYIYVHIYIARQCIVTSAEVTPNAGDCKGILPKMTLIQVKDVQ